MKKTIMGEEKEPKNPKNEGHVSGVRKWGNTPMSAKKVEFGQVNEKHNNSMKPRTSIAIALRPSRNEHGGHYLSLHTGKRMLRRKCKESHMPNDIVDAVHRQGAAPKQAGGITFTDKEGNIITYDEDTEDENAKVNSISRKQTIAIKTKKD